MGHLRGADLGGNFTLIGSSAAVVVVGISSKYGFRLTFSQWFKVRLPFTLLTLAIGMICLCIHIYRISKAYAYQRIEFF